MELMPNNIWTQGPDITIIPYQVPDPIFKPIDRPVYYDPIRAGISHKIGDEYPVGAQFSSEAKFLHKYKQITGAREAQQQIAQQTINLTRPLIYGMPTLLRPS